MIMKNILFKKGKDAILKMDVCYIQDWDGFDKLIKFLSQNYFIQVLKRADGPDARRWILESDGKMFELIHDDEIGNYFLASTEESEALLHTIGEDLEQRFAKIK